MALWDQVESFINESVRFSKEAYEKAKELGNLTKMELEVKNLQGQLQKELAQLGGVVHHLLAEEDRSEVSRDDEAVSRILGELEELNRDLARKEAEMDKIRRERNNGEKRE